jgi:hypothetical protein
MLNVFIQHSPFNIQYSSVSLFGRSPTRPSRPSAPATPSPTKSPPSLRLVSVRSRRGVGRGAGGRRGRGGGGRLSVRPRAATTSPATSPRTVLLLLLLLLLLRRATLLPARLGARRLPFARKLLLELLHLLLHELARSRLLPNADLVVPAVGAATPAFGISLFAGRAEDALRERHLESIPSRADGEGSPVVQLKCRCSTGDASLRSA